jgi:hypothetical protein
MGRWCAASSAYLMAGRHLLAWPPEVSTLSCVVTWQQFSPAEKVQPGSSGIQNDAVARKSRDLRQSYVSAEKSTARSGRGSLLGGAGDPL